MKSNGIDNGVVTGLVESFPFVGLASGMLNNEQMISDANTFIFTVKTDVAVAATRTFQLPLVSTGVYNFWIDWGDGRKDYVTSFAQIYRPIETVARTHTYRTAGTYTIKITGVCRGWSFYLSTNEPPKIQSVERWGCLELIDDIINGQQFANCNQLDLSNVKDTPRLTYMTTFQQTFQYCTNLKIGLINNWDVSNMTYFSTVFTDCSAFNNFIGNWDVSNVTYMGFIFSGASAFNQHLDSWDVSKVADMRGIFQTATSFNQPLVSWNVGNVTQMPQMFNGATAFNQPIDSWNVSKVTNMSTMFSNATAFDQDIGSWDIGLVTNITNFMLGKTPATFSAANLDAIYNGWSSRPSQSNLSITFGTAKYTAASSAGRAILVSRGWTIVDGGI